MNYLPRLMPLLVLAAVLAVGCDGKSKQDVPSVGKDAPVETSSLARSNPSAGKIDYVSVTAEGHGPTVSAAVDQAIQLAIQQVNGKTLDSSSMQFRGGMAVSFGDENVDIGSSAFAEFVATRSRGAVTDFKLLSRKDLADGSASVTIEARVAKYAKPESAALLRITVAPFRTDAAVYKIDQTGVPANSVVQTLRQSITNVLAQSQRVSVIDREFSTEVEGELALLETGKMATEEFARLGEQLLADYVLVGHIDRYGYERNERQLRTSDRTLVSHSGGAAVSLRLINVTTGQIELSQTVVVDLPPTEATTLGTSVDAAAVQAEMSRKLSEQAGAVVMARLFPVTVVAVEGADVVLSQGGSLLIPGNVYDVVLRGKEVTDPQTGRVIGRIEKPCCTVKVDRVTADLSYATVVDSAMDINEVFAPGALEIQGPGTRPVSALVEIPRAESAATPQVGGIAKDEGAVQDPSAAPAPTQKVDKDW